MSTSALCNSFTQTVSCLERETKVLKCISNLRSLTLNRGTADHDNLFTKLQQIETITNRLMQELNDVEETLDLEIKGVENCKEVLKLARVQAENIANIENEIPKFLTIASSSSSNQGIACSSVKSVLTVGGAVEVTEFEKVSTATRGKLTLTQVNESFLLLKKLVAEKDKAIQIPKKKIPTNKQQAAIDEYQRLLLSDHQAPCCSSYLTEAEVRDSLGKNPGTLLTLRALGRIRMIKSNAINTYVLVKK